jgi:hypothetical protein
VLHGCPPSPDAWGRLSVVTPFHHLSEDSHINCSLRARPITASNISSLNIALSAVPIGAVAFALIAGTTAVTTVHPRQVLAKLRHFHPLSAQPVKGTKEPALKGGKSLLLCGLAEDAVEPGIASATHHLDCVVALRASVKPRQYLERLKDFTPWRRKLCHGQYRPLAAEKTKNASAS